MKGQRIHAQALVVAARWGGRAPPGGTRLLPLPGHPGRRGSDVERDILRWWRTNLGLSACVQQQDMPQGGWTETADAGRVDLPGATVNAHRLASSPSCPQLGPPPGSPPSGVSRRQRFPLLKEPLEVLERPEPGDPVAQPGAWRPVGGTGS